MRSRGQITPYLSENSVERYSLRLDCDNSCRVYERWSEIPNFFDTHFRRRHVCPPTYALGLRVPIECSHVNPTELQLVHACFQGAELAF